MVLGIFSFLLDFTYFVLERVKGKAKGRKRNINVCLSLAGTAGDLAHNPGMYTDKGSNWRSFSSQSGTQCTELHQAVLVLGIL